jgi:flagellar protein FlgJ
MDKAGYIDSNHNLASQAGKYYNINPVIILAQGAMESGWGGSDLAKKANNYFGILASGAKNEFWDGDYVTVHLKKLDKKLKFRKYSTVKDSFFDFARLIKSSYSNAAAVSYNLQSYALVISQSKYISEDNGDNREGYRKGVESNAVFIDDYLKKKAVMELKYFRQLGLAFY